MNVAFIATVNLDDLSDLAGVAQEINDDLAQSGFEVISVAAWARPALAQVAPTVPTTQTQPIQTNPNI